MAPQEWMGLLGGVGLCVGLAVLARMGLVGGAMRQEQGFRFECPNTHAEVDCRIVQDLRTGQWARVTACSAFADPTQLECGQDCRHRLNLGLLRPRVRAA